MAARPGAAPTGDSDPTPRTGQGAGPHVFVDALDAPVLSEDDAHHLARVLRARPGDPLTCSDGRGSWVPAVMTDDPRHPELRGDIRVEPALHPPLAVAFAPVKGDRPEWAVQKLTELGLERLVVLETDRSVVRWHGPRADRQLDRLSRVAREAAMQCGRCRLPVVEGPFDYATVAAQAGAVRADRGGAPPTLDHPLVLVGPEGGWSDRERAIDLPTMGLGPTVLRAETAAVAAGVILVALRSGLVAGGGHSERSLT